MKDRSRGLSGVYHRVQGLHEVTVKDRSGGDQGGSIGSKDHTRLQ